ncbi:unnamed protein product [Chrysodeixis includens]|uniref:Uncharacterized protein n=1 Tax=Chrysodeixis includens TaxID=689277 RepID=A0A9P0BQJ5_CHRIL|nr:unnamed protein product [Chrysodeixis includens]
MSSACSQSARAARQSPSAKAAAPASCATCAHRTTPSTRDHCARAPREPSSASYTPHSRLYTTQIPTDYNNAKAAAPASCATCAHRTTPSTRDHCARAPREPSSASYTPHSRLYTIQIPTDYNNAKAAAPASCATCAHRTTPSTRDHCARAPREPSSASYTPHSRLYTTQIPTDYNNAKAAAPASCATCAHRTTPNARLPQARARPENPPQLPTHHTAAYTPLRYQQTIIRAKAAAPRAPHYNNARPRPPASCATCAHRTTPSTRDHCARAPREPSSASYTPHSRLYTTQIPTDYNNAKAAAPASCATCAHRTPPSTRDHCARAPREPSSASYTPHSRLYTTQIPTDYNNAKAAAPASCATCAHRTTPSTRDHCARAPREPSSASYTPHSRLYTTQIPTDYNNKLPNRIAYF